MLFISTMCFNYINFITPKVRITNLSLFVCSFVIRRLLYPWY